MTSPHCKCTWPIYGQSMVVLTRSIPIETWDQEVQNLQSNFHVFYGQLPIVSIYYVYIPYKLWPIDHNPYCLCTTKFLWARDHSFKKLAKQNPNHETQMNEVIYYRYNTFLLQFAGIWYLVNIHSFYGQNICSFALDAAAMSGQFLLTVQVARPLFTVATEKRGGAPQTPTNFLTGPASRP